MAMLPHEIQDLINNIINSHNALASKVEQLEAEVTKLKAQKQPVSRAKTGNNTQKAA